MLWLVLWCDSAYILPLCHISPEYLSFILMLAILQVSTSPEQFHRSNMHHSNTDGKYLVAQLAACVDCCNQCGVGSRVELSLWQYAPAVSIVVIVTLQLLL